MFAMNMRLAVCAALVLAAAASLSAQTAASTDEALKYLSQAINDPKTVEATLVALRSTRDKDLLALFTALTRSTDRNKRLFAASSLREMFGAEAAPILLERLKKDPIMLIRSEALAQLLELKAVSQADLLEALEMPDENVQCIAARELVRQKQFKPAVDVLKRLAESKDVNTYCLARLSLLGTGDSSQLEPLKKVVSDRKTPQETLELVLGQISEEKNVAAVELAEMMIPADPTSILASKAYRAISDASPDGGQRVVKAMRQSSQTVFKVHLMRVLAVRSDAKTYLEPLASGDDTVAAVARFELARAEGGEAASRAAKDLLAQGHPVVIDYLLFRAREDIADRPEKAAFYVPALAEIVRAAPASAAKMQLEHVRAAQAATLLADLGTPEATDALKALLATPYGGVLRSAAAGLLRTKNDAMGELSRPLLRSPYSELVTDAALVLARLKDKDAAPPLREILARAGANPPSLAALASYYLLKIDGKSLLASEQLAREVK